MPFGNCQKFGSALYHLHVTDFLHNWGTRELSLENIKGEGGKAGSGKCQVRPQVRKSKLRPENWWPL